MLTRMMSGCLAFVCCCLFSPPCLSAGEDQLDVAQIVAMGGAGKPDAAMKEKPGLFPKFEDVTKDMVSKKGLFTLWSYPDDAQDKDKEKLLCQIPSGFLGEKFMLSVSFSGGGFMTGFPLERRVVRWEMLDRQLVLGEPETGYVVNQDDTVSQAKDG